MHDGSVESLDQVLEHYMSGGKAHPHKSELIQPFTLTNDEKQDLIQFLHALTDHTFLTNPAYSE